MKNTIKQLVASIHAYDQLEQEHINNVINWIESGVDIFRIKKPDIPPKHLVSYFVLVDGKATKMLLVNHKKAGKWLPPGGHVEKDEHPADTVKREIKEELGIKATFIFDNPFFITVTRTVNVDAGHTDVSLWYLLQGDMAKAILYDHREFNGYQWLSPKEIVEMDSTLLDPHMHRFINKLLASNTLIR